MKVRFSLVAILTLFIEVNGYALVVPSIPYSIDVSTARSPRLPAFSLDSQLLQPALLKTDQVLPPEQTAFIETVLKPTFSGLEALIEPTTGLPYDILNAASLRRGELIGGDNPFKSSGLAIGLYIAGLIAQRDLGMINDTAARAKLRVTLATLEKIKANETITFTTRDGKRVTTTFPYKWLDPRNGERTIDFEIPSIDGGQLAYSLAVITEAFKGTPEAAQAQKLLDRMDFRLFEKSNGVMALAYNRGKLHNNNIDLWGSEGIVSALLGIAKDGVSSNALPKPSTQPGGAVVTYTAPDGREIPVIPAFDGSMFTTLFPLMFWGTDPKNVHSGILENARRFVLVHKLEGERLKLPVWGWAPAQDADGAYHEYGVSAVSNFGTPLQDTVAAYASFLALNLKGYAQAESEIQAAIGNLNEFKKFKAEGREAFDSQRGYTDSVNPLNGRVAGNILGLDKGTEAISLYNYIQRAKGAASFDTYFWSYLTRIGKAQEARDLLRQRGEEITSLIGEIRMGQKPPTQQPASLDVLITDFEQAAAGFKFISDASGGDILKREFVKDPEGKRGTVLKLEYEDKNQWAAKVFVLRDKLPIPSDMKFLVLEVRGESEFPAQQFKIELKKDPSAVWNGYTPEGFGKTWKSIYIPLDGKPDWFDALGIVLEGWNQSKSGVMYIDRIGFAKAKP